MIRNFIVAICLFASLSLNAMPTDTTVERDQRLKVGLVLSGGGAKGMAHIGILKVLEEIGMPIDYIAGTSMGSIIGGLYAIGYSPEKIDSICRNQDWTTLLTSQTPRDKKLYGEKEINDKTVLSVPFTLERVELPSGILSGEKVLNMLSMFTTGYHDMATFDSLPIPFACISYDVNTGDEVVLRSGNLATAIRASMSIPGAFNTVNIDGKILIDGGVINNFPVDIVKQMGADVVIGVDVSLLTENRENIGEDEEDQFGSIAYITQRLTDRMGKERFMKNLEATDFYIHPNVRPYTTASFTPTAIDSLILRGEKIASQQRDSLIAFRDYVYGNAPHDYQLPQEFIEKGGYPLEDSINIGKIIFSGIGALNEHNLKRLANIEDNSRVSYEDIFSAIDHLNGTGWFYSVSFELSSYKSDNYDIVFNCTRKSNNSVNLGIRFDSEELTTAFVQATLLPKELNGVAVDLRARLSASPYIKAGVYYQNALLGRSGISYTFRRSNFDLYTFNNRDWQNMIYYKSTISLDIADFFYRNLEVSIGLKYDLFVPRSSEFFKNDTICFDEDNERMLIYSGSIRYDNFDNAFMPHKGVCFNAEYSFITDDLVKYQDEKPVGIASASVTVAIPLGLKATLLPNISGRYINKTYVPFSYKTFVGGIIPNYYLDEQIPLFGINQVAMMENNTTIIGCEFRYRIIGNHHVWVRANAAHTSAAPFNMNTSSSDVHYFHGESIGYTFDSPIGPLTAMINYTSLKSMSNNVSFYISIGKYF